MSIEEKVIDLLVKKEIKNVYDFKDEINSYGFIEMILDIEALFQIKIDDSNLIMEDMCNVSNIVKCVEELIEDVKDE